MKTIEKNPKKVKIFEILLAIGLALFLLTGVWSLHRQQNLADKVVRLHILANSDSQTDQTLKLQVRDRLLARATEILEASGDRAEAEKLLTAALPELQTLAAEEIEARGYQYPVTAELTDSDFPTKEYDGFTLPAGEYLALRIVIGQGNGHNWWCVVFPPLCTQTTTDVPAAAMAAGLNEDDLALITEENSGYVLKFKALEWWSALKEKVA
ncbi:MAG: stage II sporulation protein R [Oscillibacter sp.]